MISKMGFQNVSKTEKRSFFAVSGYQSIDKINSNKKGLFEIKKKNIIYQCRVRVIRTLGHWHSDSSEATQQSAASNEGCK